MKNLTSTERFYFKSISSTWKKIDWDKVNILSNDLLNAWRIGSKVFICGNGGSAANANHLANDLLYGISPKEGKGIKVHSLCANIAVNTCLANDTGYENIFLDSSAPWRNQKIFSLSFREAAIPQMLSKPSLKHMTWEWKPTPFLDLTEENAKN